MATLRPPSFALRDMAEWAKWLQEQQIEAGLGNPDVDDRVLVSTAAGVRSWARRIDNWPAQFRGSTNQALSTSAITVDMVTTDYDPGVHYAINADNILIGAAGWYRIDYTVYASVNSTTGTNNCNVLAFLRKNGTVIPGSYHAAYLREVNLPDTSCSGFVLVLCSAGDAIDLRAQLSAAQDTSTVGDRCKIVIERVR